MLAQHYTQAGLTEQAIAYWQQAGEHASDRSANVEAVSHFTTGIELLTILPATPVRTQHTLTLHIALGAALQVAKGFAAPEVERAYARARELCQQVGETPEIVPVLYGLWRFYRGTSLRGWALAEAYTLVEQQEERWWEAEVDRHWGSAPVAPLVRHGAGLRSRVRGRG